MARRHVRSAERRTRLAETAITPNQAFAYGTKVLALQFHVEPPRARLERWLIGHTMELAAAKIDLAEFRAETARFGLGLSAPA